MKKEENAPLKFESLSEASRAMGLPEPKHPLIGVINGINDQLGTKGPPHQHVLSFYKISYKPKLSGKVKYGQSYYDFDGGGLLFAAPGQIIGSNDGEGSVCSDYALLIHPDFFLGYPLAKAIRQYGFFSYATNETLHLSEAEKETIIGIFKMIQFELDSRIDDFSQNVVIAQIDLLLNYANRFYKRQFITRKAVNSELFDKMQEILEDYFSDEKSLSMGIPTVQFLATSLNVSPSYLSDMLRSLTGQNAQQHIHSKLIDKAKEDLSTTGLAISEIAYKLGFEHPSSFNKLFKAKTKLSPLAFRRSFN
jgi:AraC-like DNA-binding protein